MKPLNFSEVTPYTVSNWIERNNIGDSLDYNRGKEDTQTVIRRLKRLPFELFNNVERLKSWFLKNLEMRQGTYGTLYRAFLSLRNDKNINLRIADHYSTKSNVLNAVELFGQPDYEYHLNIPKEKKDKRKGVIKRSRFIEFEEISVDVIVATIWVDEFIMNGDENCSKAIDDLIFLLKYGSINNDTNESLLKPTYIVGFEQFKKYKFNTMPHIKRIDEMFSQQPTASEVYNKVVNGISPFKLYAEKNTDKKIGEIIFRHKFSSWHKTVEMSFNKQTDEIYSIVMFKDIKGLMIADHSNSKSIKDIDTKSSDEIATEIINYIEGNRQ